MKLLNLGCGGYKLSEPWVNVDCLYQLFPVGTLERSQIDALPNYVDADFLKPLPFEDLSIDGILLSHVLEHFDAQDGLRLLIECYRVLKPQAPLLLSVPDASYFRRVYPEDRNENWPRLFDTTDPANPIPTFFEAALWFNEHKAILTEDAVWAYLRRAGFSVTFKADDNEGYANAGVLDELRRHLNRTKFSVDMFGVK